MPRIFFAVVLITLLLSGLACHRASVESAPSPDHLRRTDDILRAALLTESPPLPRSELQRYARFIQQEADAISAGLSSNAPMGERFAALNGRFFGAEGYAAVNDSSGPEAVSVARVLDTRRGTCMGLAVVYLALSERLGLDAHGVATPDHLFIRVRLGDAIRNVELLEGGRETDDDTYRRRHKIDPASIEAGVFMRDLTDGEMIAHLLSNQGVALSRLGKLEEAIVRYDAALELHPTLVAAHYNRGLDLMNLGRLQEALASFDAAIELHAADAQAHNNRGLVRLKLGDRDGARDDFKRALELEPALKEAEENLRRLVAAGDP